MEISNHSRRSFLAMAGLGTAFLGTTALTGCGQRTPPGAVVGGTVVLPQYLPAKNFKPDLPASSEGVPAAFYNYPEPYKTVAKPPLSGQRYRATTLLFGPVANSREGNPVWQEIEKRLGGSIELTAVSSDDYSTKFNTQVASGNLPDMMFNDSVAIKDIVSFLAASCADLTPYLSGENIKQYPNLAAIPEVYWKACIQAGKIYFLPIPRGLTGGSGFFNQTLLKQAGVESTEQIKNKDDFTALVKELTRPEQNQWALGSTGFGLPTFYHVFRSPFQWRQDQNKLVKDFETDEYLAAIEYAAGLYQAGYYCPGSDGWTKSQMVNAFVSGKVTMIYDGLPAYLSSTGYAQSLPQANASYRALPIIPFGHDGGKGRAWIDNVVVGTTMLKKADDGTVKDLLAVANFLAAPFGSEEYLLINYGLPGIDYAMDANGNPQPTPQAQQHTGVPWKFVAAPQQAIYSPTDKTAVDALHSAYQKLIPGAAVNPCANLFSPTDAAKGSVLAKPVSDAVKGFIAGRQPMDDVKNAVAKWKQSGGDTIRAEYEKLLAT